MGPPSLALAGSHLGQEAVAVPHEAGRAARGLAADHAAQGVAGIITPSRRGIGPMTITMLLRNTLRAYRARCGC